MSKNNNNKVKNEEQSAETVVSSFSTKRLPYKSLKTFYSDEIDKNNRLNQTTSYANVKVKKIEEITNIFNKALDKGFTFGQKKVLVDASKRLYMINPIYQDLINYYADFFIFRYKVIPHKLYSNSKIKALKEISEVNYGLMYRQMLEVVDGIGIETTFKNILLDLFITGSAYLTTFLDNDRYCVSTIILPTEYCRPVAQTQYGTQVIEFDLSYFDTIRTGSEKDIVKFIKESFSEEFAKMYEAYKKDTVNNRWQILDPRFSTGILLNPEGIPSLLYAIGSLQNYELYQDNELERNSNLLKYLVVQTMPHFQQDLIFTVDEVQDLHRSLRNKIEVDDKARLITTWGEVHVEKISDTDSSDSDVTAKAFRDIFNNAGLNSTLFVSDSVEALKMALKKDKSMLYTFVEQITNFYTIVVNNGWDWKMYQADIEILPISNYTYNDDIKIYKDNATLGVNKLDYIIASGT